MYLSLNLVAKFIDIINLDFLNKKTIFLGFE